MDANNGPLPIDEAQLTAFMPHVQARIEAQGEDALVGIAPAGFAPQPGPFLTQGVLLPQLHLQLWVNTDGENNYEESLNALEGWLS